MDSFEEKRMTDGLVDRPVGRSATCIISVSLDLYSYVHSILCVVECQEVLPQNRSSQISATFQEILHYC